MTKYRNLAIMIITIAALGTATIAYMQRPHEFTVPQLGIRSPGMGAEAEYENAQRAALFYRDEIQRHPGVVKNYVALAQLFLQESRVTARHHDYVPKAAALLDEALRLSPDDFEAMLTRATMLLTLHHFQEAKDLALMAISSHEFNASAYGILCDACVELGDYPSAIKACDRMLAIRPDLRSYARAAYLREIHGNIGGACEAMGLAVEAGIPGQENRAWTSYNLGNLYLQAGKLDTAEYILDGILAERPNYAYALSGLAQVRFARGQTDSAISILTRAAQLTPEHLFMEQLADIYRATGKAREADGIARIVLASFEQHQKDGWNVDREYALFCANHGIKLSAALSRAEEEYRQRPGNVDVLDTFAWVLYKNGKVQEASAMIDRALALNPGNPVFCYHAGVIRHAAGDQPQAQQFLRRALAQNPVLPMLYAGDAKKLLETFGDIAQSAQ